jgi:hypothetical protein
MRRAGVEVAVDLVESHVVEFDTIARQRSDRDARVACQKILSGRLGEHGGERGARVVARLGPAIAASIELDAHPATLRGFRGAAERRPTTYKRRVTKTCPTDAATTIS